MRAAAPDDLEAPLDPLAQLHPAFPTDPARANDVLATMLNQDGRLVLVAEAGRRVSATADLIIVPNLTHDVSPRAIVENFVGDEQSRGRRARRALIHDIVTRAEQAGCHMIQLVSPKHRVAAHAFYVSNQWRKDAVDTSTDTPHRRQRRAGPINRDMTRHASRVSNTSERRHAVRTSGTAIDGAPTEAGLAAAQTTDVLVAKPRARDLPSRCS